MSHTLKKCDICTFVSTKTSNVKRHMKRHDPLHCNLLGPGNDCIDKMEELWKDSMFSFYKRHALSNVTIKLFLFEYNLCLSFLSSKKCLVPK